MAGNALILQGKRGAYGLWDLEGSGVAIPTSCCGILTDTKSRLRSLGMRPNPSLSSPLKALRRLSGVVWRPAGCRAKGLRGIESP